VEETVTARLVIVEDHGLIAETVATALAADGFEVAVVDAVTSQDVVADVAEHDPEVVLLDLDLAGRDATPLIPDLGRGGAAVVMLTGITDPIRLARCVRAGAVGIVDKGVAFADLLDAVLETLEHGALLTSHEREEHLALLRKHEAGRARDLEPFERLTPREAEVLGELVEGHSVDAIAKVAVVSVATVRTQVRAILRKLGVTSQLEAIAEARRIGWTPPQERD
jgi:DNA-binding NarL/FixJ family response regulator